MPNFVTCFGRGVRFCCGILDGIAGNFFTIALNRLDGNGGIRLAIVGAGVAFGIHSQLCLRNCNGDSLRFCRGVILITGVGGLHIVGAHCDGNVISFAIAIGNFVFALLICIEGICDVPVGLAAPSTR